ncbi:related to Mig2 [Ustilago sp. UG-2017b]|nr:related to Mig2 [Ustilago sp. UG-2017b]
MFPKSLLFAFVASSLFLANVGVEASSKANRLDTFDTYHPSSANNLKKRSPLETTDPRIGTPHAIDYYQGVPKSITITSSLSTTPADKGYLGICKLPFYAFDGVFVQDVYLSGSSVKAFMDAAQNTAKCTWTTPTDVQCVEQGGNAYMKADDINWWRTAFCKRCSDAGGKSRTEFNCPDDSNGAKTKEKKDGRTHHGLTGDKE